MKRRTRDFRAWLVEAISCYDTSAELFMAKRKGGPRRPIGYRRFATAVEKATRGIIPAAARTLFPAHRHSAVAAHRRVAAERDNNTELGP